MLVQNIILITDNNLINHLIREHFNHSQYNIIDLESNVNNLIDEIELHSPDLVILGRTLKYADGLKICNKISRSENSSLTKILLIATDKSVGVFAIDEGANGFLHIPFTGDDLKLIVDELLYRAFNVLIVDDSKSIHAVLGVALISKGYNILKAYDGVEALKIINGLKDKIDIVISDIEMPLMDGFTLCEKIRENESTSKLPIILATSHDGQDAINRGFKLGANDYLTKPIVISELTERISNILLPKSLTREEIVLLVEDNRFIKDMMAQSLMTHGFNVVEVNDGRSALDLIRVRKFNLVIIDLDIKGGFANEIARTVRNSDSYDTPIIVTTESAKSSAELVSIRSVGIQAIINKPFKPEQIISEVERVIAQYKHHKQRVAFSSYLSNETLEAIDKRGKIDNNEPRAVDQHRTILFCDLVGFTGLTESLGARQIVDMLNIYFDHMISILMNHGANIDKLIGDCIMAIFSEREEGAKSAVKAGLEMVSSLANLNKRNNANYHIRIGINSGHVITGDIGSVLHRRDFTCIGDTVNVASRLESIAGRDQIFVSESTKSLLDKELTTKQEGEINVKGRAEAVKVHKVLGE